MAHQSTLLYLYETMRSKEVIATGYYPKLEGAKDSSFVVLKGAKMRKQPTHKTLKDTVTRNRLEATHPHDEHYYTFTTDTHFQSPSHAASILLGKEVDGYALWVDTHDVPLSELF